jgi:enamine deaminase RidA (YjgF/YER057c/UK114 family)
MSCGSCLARISRRVSRCTFRRPRRYLGGTSDFELLDPPGLNKPSVYSHVGIVTGGRLVFIAGQTSFDECGDIVGVGDPVAQAEQTYRNLLAALKAVGAGPEHIVKWNGYLVPGHDWLPILSNVRPKYFGSIRPTSTHVYVAALIRPELLIEVEAVAVIPA